MDSKPLLLLRVSSPETRGSEFFFLKTSRNLRTSRPFSDDFKSYRPLSSNSIVSFKKYKYKYHQRNFDIESDELNQQKFSKVDFTLFNKSKQKIKPTKIKNQKSIDFQPIQTQSGFRLKSAQTYMMTNTPSFAKRNVNAVMKFKVRKA